MVTGKLRRSPALTFPSPSETQPAWGAVLAPSSLSAQKGQGALPAKSVDLQELTA